MARLLNVYLGQALTGQLAQDDVGTARFRYDPAWLKSPAAMPLSRSLPLRPNRFTPKETRPFFAGLLPEEDSRRLVASALGISARNDFAMLERIGSECAGAVSLLRSNESPAAAPPHYREISLGDLAGKFAELPRHPLLAGEDGIRLSLAGAQGKLPVRFEDRVYSLALDGSPSTHILKPKSPHFDGLVENEFFCMRLAFRLRLDVASVEIETAGETPFLQVTRFDRLRLPDGELARIHQEDFCQALGIPPELKYQQEGGPSLKTCFDLVRAASSVPGPDVLNLFDAVTFNFLAGNNDAHGKNFSLLYAHEGARLAPLYDLVCTQAYAGLSPLMAMKIGDEQQHSRVSEKDWQKFYDDAGLSRRAAQARVLQFARRVQQETERLRGERTPGAESVAPVIFANCQRLLTTGVVAG